MVVGHGSFVGTLNMSIRELVNSKQNPRVLKGDKNHSRPFGEKNLAEIETIAEVNISEKGQPSAD